MKTKTLLIAAAALAAGVISSQAQVYSQNIVGYVNVRAANGQFTLINNPLDNGANNVLSNLFVGTPPATSVQVWDSNVGTFVSYNFSAGHWKQGTVNSDNVQIPPGAGFFIKPGGTAPYTNTFVGSVIVSSGSTGTNAVGSGFQLVGSLVPFADTVTNTSTMNLVVPPATSLQQWDVGSQSFNSFTFSAGHWKQGTVVTNPVIKVGEGFFLNAPSSFNWVEKAP